MEYNAAKRCIVVHEKCILCKISFIEFKHMIYYIQKAIAAQCNLTIFTESTIHKCHGQVF